MTATASRSPSESMLPLADYLGAVLRGLRPLPPLDLDLTQAHGNTLAEDVVAPGPLPAFDHAAIDGYAARYEDVAHAMPGRPVRLNVVGDLTASSWRPVRLTSGTCFSVAAGAPLPATCDVIVPASSTDQGMAAVEIHDVPKKGHGVRRAGDELVDAGRASQPGQVVDVNSHALTAAAAEAGAHAYRVGICDDDPEAVRAVLDDQTLRADLIITTGGTGTGPGDMIRRIMSRGPVSFTDVSVYPCSSLGFGTIGGTEVPVVCLPGDPGAALIGFEVLAHPVIQVLAGAEPVFRPSVRAHLLETVHSPTGLREFRPAFVAERRGGGYTVQPLPGGPYTLSGLAEANALMVLGEKVTSAPQGCTVDVLLLDRRR